MQVESLLFFCDLRKHFFSDLREGLLPLFRNSSSCDQNAKWQLLIFSLSLSPPPQRLPVPVPARGRQRGHGLPAGGDGEAGGAGDGGGGQGRRRRREGEEGQGQGCQDALRQGKLPRAEMSQVLYRTVRTIFFSLRF